MDLSTYVINYGNIKELLLPSGSTAIIREQNGEDDALLSNVALAKDSSALNAFIKAVTVYLSTSSDPTKAPTLDDIMSMPLNNKYFILIASRVFSLGEELEFQYNWGGDLPPVKYVENLNDFLWDYSKELPKPGEPGYFEERIPPYKSNDPFQTLILDDGREVRYKYLDSYGEKYLLKLPETERHINQQLLARDLSLRIDGQFIKVESFKNFSSRAMAKIRAHVSENDPEFSGLTTLENPYETGVSQTISIIQVQDFFFPREI